jgi:tetratricopeptide (TPR) repeat protein
MSGSFGPEHPKVLTTLFNKAKTLTQMGRLEEARELFQSVYEIRKRDFEEDHIDTLTAAYILGFVLRNQGKFAESLEYSKAAWEGKNRLFGEEHPSTLSAMENAAWVYLGLTRLDKAREMFQKCL